MSICETLKNTVGELFECEDANEHVRIRTPYLYPDGDYIDLFVKPSAEGLTVSDLGETARWLRMQTISLRRSPKQRQMIDDACLTHGVDFYRGMLAVRAKTDGSDLSAAITRLGQAALRVSDLWFSFRTRAFESATDEVADFLTERQIPFDRGERLVGRSGRTYSIDFHTRTQQRSNLIAVLSTGSRSAAARVVEHVVATWYDLNHLQLGQEPVGFVSLFDDTLDVWRPEEFRLVEEISTVARWSAQDEFVGLLAAA
ncbi:MAG: DUF1828 domain-containing protein [Thermoguttaceae bacterium]|jgi:hypothetical protein|nr:DUF1828 domain-containing protein [Thermoguttaceae bacterium]